MDCALGGFRDYSGYPLKSYSIIDELASALDVDSAQLACKSFMFLDSQKGFVLMYFINRIC